MRRFGRVDNSLAHGFQLLVARIGFGYAIDNIQRHTLPLLVPCYREPTACTSFQTRLSARTHPWWRSIYRRYRGTYPGI